MPAPESVQGAPQRGTGLPWTLTGAPRERPGPRTSLVGPFPGREGQVQLGCHVRGGQSKHARVEVVPRLGFSRRRPTCGARQGARKSESLNSLLSVRFCTCLSTARRQKWKKKAKVEKKKVWIAFFVKNAPRSTRPHRTRIFSLASSPGFRYLLASVNDTVDGPYVGDRSAESLPD